MIANNERSTSSNESDFYKMLDYEFNRASRYQYDVTLLFIKLCNLSEIGILYGQLTASLILSKIERLIKANIRSSDHEYIYGNDELMIIVPQTPKDKAEFMIQKLKRLMDDFCFSNGKEPCITIAPKFGVASYPYDAQTRDGVVKLADNDSI